MDWTTQLLEQLTFHWDHHARPRLDGLSDDEYLWEPVPGMWSLRDRDKATTPMAAGAGHLVLDYEYPTPDPPPVTTIAWRIAHITVGVFGQRNANHFGNEPMSYESVVWEGTADNALALLDRVYADWIAGVGKMDEAKLASPCGPAEGPFAEYPYAGLVLHIHREAIHHLAEIALLRDLYQAQH